jgi:hypothetical protein
VGLLPAAGDEPRAPVLAAACWIVEKNRSGARPARTMTEPNVLRRLTVPPVSGHVLRK